MITGAGDNLQRSSGVTAVIPSQLGFPGVLTSAWDDTTGYSWRRTELRGLSVAESTMPVTGNRAVTVNNDTTLVAGTEGWFEPYAGRTGYLFTPAPTATPTACRGVEWVDALRPGDCLEVSVVGDDTVTPVTLTSADGLTWTSGDDTITICGAQYAITFTPGEPPEDPVFSLVLVSYTPDGEEEPVDAAPVVLGGRLGCAGCNFAVFGFSRFRLCPCAETLPGGPCANLVRLKLEAVACPGVEIDNCDDGVTEVPVPLYATFYDDLAALGTVRLGTAGAIEISSSLQNGLGVVLSELLASDPVPLVAVFAGWQTANFGGSWCNTQRVLVQIDYLNPNPNPNDGVGWSAVPPQGLAVTTFPVEIELEPAAELAIFGITGTSRVVISDVEPAPAAAAGYTVPGWYVLAGASAPTELDETTKCGPWDIACGPYETEGEAQAALDAGCGDDCESIEGWFGPGWYCVQDAAVCVAVELLDEDRCDDTIVICNGPFADEATATANCAESGGGLLGGSKNCCPEYTTGVTGATMFMSSGCGGFSAAPMTWIDYGVGGEALSGALNADGTTVSLYCLTGGEWAAIMHSPGIAGVFLEASPHNCDVTGISRTYQFTIPPGQTFGCAGAVIVIQFNLT
jgi:hypothetical protein